MRLYPEDTPLTMNPCYGELKPITLSWTRLSDWLKCHHRVKLIYTGKKNQRINARSFLAGKVVDLCLRRTLEEAERDPDGRVLFISKDHLLRHAEEIWDDSVTNPEKGRFIEWKGPDILSDQKNLFRNVTRSLKNLHPILEDRVVGHRVLPEFRPRIHPVVGIPGLDGETSFIRLFLAVDILLQEYEDPVDPKGFGEWSIIDLKTTASDQYLSKTLPQLVFYDIAFHALTGKRPIGHELWAPLVNDSIRSVVVTDEHRRQMMSWIISFCHGVWSGEDAITTNTDNCFGCPTYDACPKRVRPTGKDEKGRYRISFLDL